MARVNSSLCCHHSATIVSGRERTFFLTPLLGGDPCVALGRTRRDSPGRPILRVAVPSSAAVPSPPARCAPLATPLSHSGAVCAARSRGRRECGREGLARELSSVECTLANCVPPP